MNRFRTIGLALLGVLALAASIDAKEEILLFHSEIHVRTNNTMTVTETIRIRAEGNQIKQGIFRDFPTTYKDRLGKKMVVGFEVKEALRDGKKEPFHLKAIPNGQRVYLGKKGQFLKKGEYTYTLTYETDHQIGFFKEYDELYWNATGSFWAFPIREAVATVYLPKAIPREKVHMEGYTGKYGSKETALTSELDDDGNPVFRATRKLNPKEGLSIVVTWPKGYMAEPTAKDQAMRLFIHNKPLVIVVTGWCLLLSYFMAAWAIVGKDPDKGTIIPLFKPPRGLSPAAMRYIIRMGYDNNCFAAALINLGVRGFVTINEKDKVFTVEKTTPPDLPLSKGEGAIYDALLGTRSSIKLKQTNHASIGAAVRKLQSALRKEHRADNFKVNGGWLVPGILLTLATIGGLLLVLPDKELVFLVIWISFWSIGVIALTGMVIKAWKGVKNTGIGPALFITLFSVPFFAGEIFVGVILASRMGLLTVLAIILMILTIMLFYHLLKAPTLAGRRLMDEIEGFKKYLNVAERESFEAMRGPERTPELFEAYLPYALALGVDQAWSQQFESVLAKAAQDQHHDRYRSHWYHGHNNYGNLGAAAVAGAVGGALAGAIASSSTAPGSSSGSGGGGSSGGGGGGGGGGGW